MGKPNVLRRLWNRSLAKLAQWFIPDHMKRITFLVTLYHYMIRDLDNERLEELAELNKQLLLAKTDASALELPGLFTRFVWKDELTMKTSIPVDDDGLKEWIVSKMPCWLRYGRTADILSDVKKLHSFVQEH